MYSFQNWVGFLYKSSGVFNKLNPPFLGPKSVGVHRLGAERHGLSLGFQLVADFVLVETVVQRLMRVCRIAAEVGDILLLFVLIADHNLAV